MRNPSAIVVVLLLAGGASAQAPDEPAFEVASVKPGSPQNHFISFGNYPGGRISVTLFTLKMLIQEALDVQYFQVTGGPHWIEVDRFDIEAKPPASSPASHANPPYTKTPPNAEQRRMLATLLAERFHLQYHRETREGPVYLLTKGGKPLQLQPPKDPKAWPWAGSIAGGMPGGDGLAGINIGMPELAGRLSDALGRPVLDRTGLEGSYDFRLPLPSQDTYPDLVSSIMASVQGLGLKLEASKGPVETIVIDRAEKPTGNE